MQNGNSSPIAALAAPTQRTRRIEPGTTVTPLGWENPVRLAKDLATAEVLSSQTPQPRHQRRSSPVPRPGQERPLSTDRRHRGPQIPARRTAAGPCTRQARHRIQPHRHPRTLETFKALEASSDHAQPHSPAPERRTRYNSAGLRPARPARTRNEPADQQRPQSPKPQRRNHRLQALGGVLPSGCPGAVGVRGGTAAVLVS
ncbi:LLM class flavin-dependent oxidoreductase [Streptomyces sp. NPDC048565]|uniref:LLM class flavin-dependent oxidoreductase n=1 Tax=Streptomyces sp. NPDC048565 TaxID=3155266 RepID=UPI003445DCDF